MTQFNQAMQTTLSQAERKMRAHRIEVRASREREKKQANRRKFLVGELVIDTFARLLDFPPGTESIPETVSRFLPAFLAELEADPKLMRILTERAARRLALTEAKPPTSTSQLPRCVSGHAEQD